MAFVRKNLLCWVLKPLKTVELHLLGDDLTTVFCPEALPSCDRALLGEVTRLGLFLRRRGWLGHFEKDKSLTTGVELLAYLNVDMQRLP